ncbi:hypothetical protein ASC91_14455 [Pelomonas sp. Root1237]|nr:hypothetical protein ASC91_14455 [Pelomonas sp. Root1237]
MQRLAVGLRKIGIALPLNTALNTLEVRAESRVISHGRNVTSTAFGPHSFFDFRQQELQLRAAISIASTLR